MGAGGAVGFVAQQAHARQPRRLFAADGQYLNVRLFGQVRGDMAKLAGEVLVDKQHLHTAAPCDFVGWLAFA
ncbi:hypothetical protein D3C84_768450 [compost metagenome]